MPGRPGATAASSSPAASAAPDREPTPRRDRPRGSDRDLTLRIAGIEFSIQAALPVRPCTDPAYRSFHRAGTGSALRRVRIALRLRRAATPRLPPSVFASGEAWSAHGAAGKRLIAGPRSEEGVPAWTARLGRRRIEIRCGPGYLTGSGRRARIESPLAYPLDQILLVRCLGSAGIVVHGGAAVREGRAAVFAGPSGAGKTTLARLLDAAGWRVLSDDRVVIRRAGRGFTAWGTPWPGEGGFARNEGAPLAGVYLLGRGGRNRVRALAPSEALRGLLPVASVPWYDARELAGPLAVLGAVIAAGLAFSFAFRPGAAAARRLAEHLDAAP